MKVIEFKVSICCQKGKTQILKAVTKLEGIMEVSVDKQKEMLRVVGEVDPILVAKRVRKTVKTAHLVSVGEKKEKEKNPGTQKLPEKKPEPENPLPAAVLPPYCNACQLVEVRYEPYGHGGPYCPIM